MTFVIATATLVSPMTAQLHPVALDALLVAMICERRDIIAGVGDFVDIEPPLERSPCGRYHMASVAHYLPRQYTTGHLHRRAPVMEYITLGGPKIKSVNTGTGRNKSYRIPQERVIADQVRWWALGDLDQISGLLEMVTHIGKKRGAGGGQIASWCVTECEPWDNFPIMRPDGTPMRNLPVDTPGMTDASIGFGALTFPYFDKSRHAEVAMPPQTTWMGP